MPYEVWGYILLSFFFSWAICIVDENADRCSIFSYVILGDMLLMFYATGVAYLTNLFLLFYATGVAFFNYLSLLFCIYKVLMGTLTSKPMIV